MEIKGDQSQLFVLSSNKTTVADSDLCLKKIERK